VAKSSILLSIIKNNFLSSRDVTNYWLFIMSKNQAVVINPL